ncbi:MAG TPA: hypothetical protein VNS58_08990 [Puia sp.]|nr:hypothetical protein [Puia sp.]
MKMTQEKAGILNIFVDLLIKFLLAISSIGAFWFILIHLLNAKDPVQACILGVLEAMLSRTMYCIIAHFFPSIKIGSSKNQKRSNKPPDAQ